jgi:hypothetical protein
MDPIEKDFQRKKYAFILAIAIFGLLLFGVGEVQARVFGFEVDELPEGNLVSNPWFRAADGEGGGAEGWVDETGIWGLSKKLTNPAPDIERGTAARFAHNSGYGGPHGGEDATIYTVIAVNPNHEGLLFKTHWVTGFIEEATVSIYGGPGEDGPWTLVWVPLRVTDENSSHFDWTQTPMLDTEVDEGFPYYKIEFFGRYPEERTAGFKFTGVYFSLIGVPPGESATPAPAFPPVPPHYANERCGP